MSKKSMIAAMLALSSLIGCSSGGSGSAGAGQDTGGKADVKPKADEPVELIFHSNNGGNVEQFDSKYGNDLRKKFPNYTIKYIPDAKGTSLPELMAANQRVDILYNVLDAALQPLIEYNLQYDMTDLAKKHQVDLTVFEPTVIDAIRNSSGGKLYMLPTENQVLVLFYNKGIFDKFGVPYPKDGMTWDEANEVAKKLTRREGDKQYLGIFNAAPAIMFKTNQFSEPYLDPKTGKSTFERESWKKLIQTLFLDPAKSQGYAERIAELKRMPNRLDFTNTQEIAMFAFQYGFPLAVPKDLEKIDWDLVSLPTFKEQPGIGSQSASVSIGITSIAKNKDAAMEVIKYLTSAEYQMEISKKGVMSARTDEAIKKAFAQDSPNKGKNWKAVYYNKIAPISSKSPYELKVENLYGAAVMDIVTGKSDLNTALRETAEKADKAVAEEKQSKNK
ncbi:extracellular solute-binding protein [Paenibacillus mesophilus]|uniref:ABC transporter substrate-binding protein n=1 Tax=Paenibacillus mesophilus TaxID=2582849 RepID=UPI00110EAA4F|nr:extracellular solute-binding protein [Paenibacillus mesophilus]TMV48949.1 extracellular solute-binding protein [Paenibacillus mesophilus]